MPEEIGGNHVQGEPSAQTLNHPPMQPPGNQNPPPAAPDPHPNEDTAQELQKDIRSGERWLIGVGIVAILVNTFIAYVYFGQLKEMVGSSEQTDQLIHLSRQQIAQLKSQVADNHTLAEQAKTQATQTTNLAKAAGVQATATYNLSQAAKDQAASTKSMFLAERNVNRAWLAINAGVYVETTGNTPLPCPGCQRPDDHWFRIYLHLKNFGRSTAVGIEFKPSDPYFELRPRDILPPSSIMEGYKNISIVAGQETVLEFTNPYVHYLGKDIQAEFSQNKEMIWTGDIDYWDIYGQQQWYHYCFYIDFTVYPPKQIVPDIASGTSREGQLMSCSLKDNMSYQKEDRK